MKDQMKLHRCVFKHLTMNWTIPVDFGWWEDLPASIRRLQAENSDCRLLRHFAIREDEKYNCLDHKTLSPEEKASVQ